MLLWAADARIYGARVLTPTAAFRVSAGLRAVGACLRDSPRQCVSLLLFAALACALLGTPAAASAAADPADDLIYMPYGLVHNLHSTTEIDGYLAEIEPYDIDQVIFAMPTLNSLGRMKLPKHNREMLNRWGAAITEYDATHAAGLSLSAVLGGRIRTKKSGLELEAPETRRDIVSAVASTLDLGVSGVQLDLEPYPKTPGFLLLLEELDTLFGQVGFHGRFSVTAPATTSEWTPSYLAAVSRLVTQLDPLYYDSSSKTIPVYESWVRSSLAYYSANASPETRIVPVLPSYSADRWHIPSVENIATATSAVQAALEGGARVNGAGIWSGWGFLMEEEGAYDGSADRAAWQSTTVNLPFSP